MIYTHADGAISHPEEMLDFLTSRLLTSSGVFDVAGGELLVTEEDVPAMSVKVASGYAFLQKADLTKTYPVYVSVDDSVDISANASGNSRIDAIVLYYNSGATPNTDSTGVATLVAIEGTPAGSPSAPTDGAIETAIGASNPFIRIANVTVASGAVSIVDANITDQRTSATYSDLVVPAGTKLVDSNGVDTVLTEATASAVNEITAVNSATGNGVELKATGDDTNIDFLLNPKGSGVVKEGVKIGCGVYNSGAQSIPNGSWTKLTFDSEYWDTDTMHNTSTNTSRITATRAGKYLFTLNFTIAGSAGGSQRTLLISKNGGGNIAGAILAPFGGNTLYMSIPLIRDMSASDYIEATLYQDSGGALNISSQVFSAIRLGA